MNILSNIRLKLAKKEDNSEYGILLNLGIQMRKMSAMRSISHRSCPLPSRPLLSPPLPSFFLWFYCLRNGLHNVPRYFVKLCVLQRIFLRVTLQNLVFPLLQEPCIFIAKLQATQSKLETLSGSAAIASSFGQEICLWGFKLVLIFQRCPQFREGMQTRKYHKSTVLMKKISIRGPCTYAVLLTE